MYIKQWAKMFPGNIFKEQVGSSTELRGLFNKLL